MNKLVWFVGRWESMVGMLVGGLTAAMLACLFADSLSVGLDGWIISVQNIIPEEEDGLAWVPLSARS